MPFIEHLKNINWISLTPRRNLHFNNTLNSLEDGIFALEQFFEQQYLGFDPIPNDQYELFELVINYEQAAHISSTLLLDCYNIGLPLDDLAATTAEIFDLWKDYANLHHRIDSGSSSALTFETDHYQYALQLICLAILLKQEDQIHFIYDIMDFQSDALIDRLIAPYFENYQLSDIYQHPIPFAELSPFFADEIDLSATHFSGYLDKHYTQFFMSKKKGKRFTGAYALGNWAFEIAALTYLYQIDDSTYRDNPHYPHDLVIYAKS